MRRDMAMPDNFESGGPAVVCEHLEVVYSDMRAVDDVSFTVEKGQVFGLLGPNGAGKTSVVRALTTILDPSAGSARVGGHPLTDPDAVRSVIGVLPESNGYPGSVTAVDYLIYFGRLYGLAHDAAADRAGSLLSDVGLASVGRQMIKTFSRGMRQRLGIARSLVNRPQVLFLDEPTLGLDPAGREDVLIQLDTIASNDGTSVVLCSHILEDVERVCDRIAILNKGKIVSTGTVASVTSQVSSSSLVAVAVDPGDADRAIAALAAAEGFSGSVTSIPGVIEVVNSDQNGTINGLVAALSDANVSILAVQPNNSRLSDAFISLTRDERTRDGG